MVLLVNVYTCFNQLLYGVLLGLSTSPPYSSLALSPPESQTSRGMYVFPGIFQQQQMANVLISPN